jgi:hypothetical protein
VHNIAVDQRGLPFVLGDKTSIPHQLLQFGRLENREIFRLSETGINLE